MGSKGCSAKEGGGCLSTHKGTSVLVQHVVLPGQSSHECLLQKVWWGEVREALAQVHCGVGGSQFYKLHPGEKKERERQAFTEGPGSMLAPAPLASIRLEASKVGVPPAEPSCCSQVDRTKVISDPFQLKQE